MILSISPSVSIDETELFAKVYPEILKWIIVNCPFATIY